jgi:uncharacterized membrane protein YjfL (UPF0719 family)
MNITEITKWIVENSTWIFSGIGVFILGFFITKKVMNKNKQTIKNSSTGIQAGGNVKISIKK